jgi:rhodanese-related sulfurtransferase
MEDASAVQTKPCLELSVDEVADLNARQGAVLIDVNPRPRWASGHLPGAINLNANDYTAADLPSDKQMTLVFYCSDTSSSASRYAAQKAIRFGYVNVFIMPAGIRGWLAAHKPLEARR